jgi:hypothetical protein
MSINFIKFLLCLFTTIMIISIICAYGFLHSKQEIEACISIVIFYCSTLSFTFILHSNLDKILYYDLNK